MGLSKQEISDYASRYVGADEIGDFPFEGELFCLLERSVPPDRVLQDEEGWQFGGYHVCLDYLPDTDSRPEGKWVWLRFISLDAFPPRQQVIKLQPPHIVKCSFYSQDRTRQMRMVKLQTRLQQETPAQRQEQAAGGKILKFPGKKRAAHRPSPATDR